MLTRHAFCICEAGGHIFYSAFVYLRRHYKRIFTNAYFICFWKLIYNSAAKLVYLCGRQNQAVIAINIRFIYIKLGASELWKPAFEHFRIKRLIDCFFGHCPFCTGRFSECAAKKRNGFIFFKLKPKINGHKRIFIIIKMWKALQHTCCRNHIFLLPCAKHWFAQFAVKITACEAAAAENASQIGFIFFIKTAVYCTFNGSYCRRHIFRAFHSALYFEA